MNTSKLILVTAASLPLFAAPMLSHASDAAAVNACVNAFVSANLPKEQKFSVKTVEANKSPIDVYGRAQRISLVAIGVSSGKRLANATCIVARDGTVIALNGKSVTTPALADAAALPSR
jgi:hypothetical protein